MNPNWSRWPLRATCCLLILAAAPAFGWGARGHRLVTQLALDGLAPDMPAWLHDPAIISRIAEQSNEPDRWRGTHKPVINHDANTGHYIDAEDLAQYGLKLTELPRLHDDYVKAIVKARIEHPDKVEPYDDAKDPNHTKEFPGFLPYAMDEHFAKLQSSFNTLRAVEAAGDQARPGALEQAKENVIYEMGILSHYVGDAAQPLHTTRHHHGWAGDNPGGYTKDNGFHAYIDTKILELHGLTYEGLRAGIKFDRHVDARDPWTDMLAHIQRSFDAVEPLYKLQKSGELTKDPGKAFITERLTDGATMLAALYNAAWEAAKPSPGEISNYIKYNETEKAAAPKP
jgi:hypothetical protein